MGDPIRESIDGLIEWVRERRKDAPDARLTDLLAGHRLPTERLVDLACIDLMQRRRMGHAVTVETYLDEFPSLLGESSQLDLIDAELCVSSELGVRPDVEQYIQRFPELAAPIRELVRLDAATPEMIGSALIDVADSANCRDDSTNESAAFSIERFGKTMAGRSDLSSIPIDLPDWFVGEKCVTSNPGRWLIQGRDCNRGTALALKVIELPGQLSAAEREVILGGCEAAAKVRNRAWNVPGVAAIENRHLAVIRRWVFAHPWPQSTISQPGESHCCGAALRRLASLAFAIQSAHDVGATHGGIHRQNLMIDHQGNVQIVDAICSRDGLVRWLRCPPECGVNGQQSDLQYRMNLDVQGLIKLVMADSVAWQNDRASELADQLRNVADNHSDEASGMIGELLIRRSN